MSKPQRTIIAIPSDQHCGSQVGLIPDTPWNLSEGGTYWPSPGQKLIYKQWMEGWDTVKSLRGRGDRVIVVNDGDAVDGNHRGSIELVTSSVEEQERIHIECMDQAMQHIGFSKKKNDALIYVAGTYAHVMKGGMSEERIARDLDSYTVPAVSPGQPGGSDGRFLRHHLRLSVNGVLLDISHHGAGASYSPANENNTLFNKIKAVYWQSVENDLEIPRYWVRAHNHQFLTAMYSRTRGTVEGFICPSLQLKTHYGHRVANLKLASIGMLIIVVEADGESKWLCPSINYQSVQTEVI
jgi:hypothetical protein